MPEVSGLGERNRSNPKGAKDTPVLGVREACWAVAIFIFLALVYGGLILQTGVILGILMAVAVLLLLLRMPAKIRELLVSHKLAADIILSVGMTWAASGMFGQGLTLAIGAMVCAILVSIMLEFVVAK